MAVAGDTGAVAGNATGSTRRTARLAKLRAKAFRVARRHTLAVRALRLLLPLAVVALVGSYGALLFARSGIAIGDGKASFSRVEVTADDLKMKGVKYSGVTKEGGRYDVRASDAIVDFAQTGPVKLNAIEGDLTQPNGVVIRLKSRSGLLDNKKAEMDLFDGVEIDGTNGLRARMKSAKVFNKENRIVSREGVVADMPTGRITAQSMDLETKAKKATFAGNVIVRLAQEQAAAKPMIGLGSDTRAPVDVKAPRLDIDDMERHATFTGGVVAAQGESTLQSQVLKILYEGRAATPGAAPSSDPLSDTQTQTQAKKIFATGGVVIVSGVDRRIQANAVEFDVPGDLATFTGPSVEVQQGRNRLVGRRLFVDRKAGKSRLDAPAEGRTSVGRIQTTFYQQPETKPAAKPKTPDPAQAGGLLSFRTDPNAPMDVAADTLDVNDVAKQAIYRGTVRAQQGAFVMQTNELVATYTGDTGLMADQSPGGKAAPAQMSKVEAKSKVLITSQEGQTAQGDWAIFDVKANTVVLGGAVIVKQGETVISGTRLHIDTITGQARMENEPGKPALAPALAPILKPKSAPGPDGLPGVPGNIAAAPAVPPGNGACPPGRACLLTIPGTLKEQVKKAPASDAAASKAPPSAAQKPKSEGWSATTSPSPVYRSQQ